MPFAYFSLISNRFIFCPKVNHSFTFANNRSLIIAIINVIVGLRRTIPFSFIWNVRPITANAINGGNVRFIC